MKIRPVFAWYDLWVGAFWDKAKRKLYVLPLPCIGLVFELGDCPRCDGFGFVVKRIFLSLWWDVKCPECHGNGMVQLPTSLVVEKKR
jgi:hypothetical protein